MKSNTNRERLINLVHEIYTHWLNDNHNPSVDFINALKAYSAELDKYEIPSATGNLYSFKDLINAIAFEYFYETSPSITREQITERIKERGSAVIGVITPKDTIVEYTNSHT